MGLRFVVEGARPRATRSVSPARAGRLAPDTPVGGVNSPRRYMRIRTSTTAAWPVRSCQAAAKAAPAADSPFTPGTGRPWSASASANATAARSGIRAAKRRYGGVCMATPTTRPPSLTVTHRSSGPFGWRPAPTRPAYTAMTLALNGSDSR